VCRFIENIKNKNKMFGKTKKKTSFKQRDTMKTIIVLGQ